MGESIRSLTVKLGFDVDTTGADIFQSRLKNLKKSISTKGFEKDFNSKFNKSAKSMQSNAKKALAVLAGVITAGTIAALKVFKGFAGVEQARGALEFRAGGEKQFEKISKKIEQTRKETGNLVSELDALNALNIGADISGDLEFLTDNFGTVIKLAKVLGKDVSEVQQVFSQFIATGSNIEEFVKFGEEFFSVEQIEALRKASTDFSQQGIETRKQLLGGKIQEAAPRLEENFQKFLGRSQATLDKLSTATEDTVKIIGEKINPILNEAATSLTGSIDNYRKQLEKTGSFVDAWTSSFNSDAAKNVIRFFGGSTSDDSVSAGQTNNVNNVTVNVSGTGDPESVAKKVMDKANAGVIQSSARRNPGQALNTAIEPSVAK